MTQPTPQDASELLARAHADERLQLLGWEMLSMLLGEPARYFELEAGRKACHLPRTHTLFDFGSQDLWSLIDEGRLDVHQHQLRMVHTDKRGFDCLPAQAYTQADGRYADPHKVRQCFAAGATLIVQLMDRYHVFFNRLCTSLSATLGHPCQISAYLTPPDAQGLDIHHDTHDVLVMQIEGSKQFHTYPTVVERPLPQMHLRADTMQGTNPLTSPVLHAGDVLYLPRGVPHSADAGGNGSLHLSLGILPVTWASLLADLAQELYFVHPLEHSCSARALYRPQDLQRQARHAADGLCRWLESHGAQCLAMLAAQRFVQSFGARPPLPDASGAAVLALDPDAQAGGLLVDPKGSRTLDGSGMSVWAAAHPSDEALQRHHHAT